jgi:thiol-disulfide isomerase/thioredoxin
MPPQNFTQVVNANTKWVLVSFYKQPNRTFPAYNDAAAQLKALGPNPPVFFAQVDSDQNPQLASTYNVTGTLALIWFLNGIPKPYAGISLDADDIAFWVTNQIDSITVSLTELVLTLSPQNMLGHNLKSDVPFLLQNFNPTITGSKYVLVDFYAPWCSFCKALYPEYLVAAVLLKSQYGNEAVIAKVDADSTDGGKALRDKYNVTRYPTLIWFVDGKPQPYGGDMGGRADIVYWVVSQTDVNTKALTEQVPTPLDVVLCDIVAANCGPHCLNGFAPRAVAWPQI